MADLSSPYHVLLGLPAFAKLILVPHHPFPKMKLPGPHGVITICGDYKKSLEFLAAGSRLVDSLFIAEERRQLDKVVAMAQAQLKAPLPTGKAKRADDETQFQAAKDSKRVALDASDPTKFVVVGAVLSSK